MVKNMMRLLPLFALVACLGLVGCGSDGSGSSDDSSGKQEAAQEEAQEEAPSSDYAVKIGKAKVTKDYEGKSCLLVTYTFTNNSDDKTQPWTACSFDAYQDGAELETTFCDNQDSDGYSSNCKKGGTQKFQLAYVLDNKKSDVELEVTELISFDDTVIASKTVPVK